MLPREPENSQPAPHRHLCEHTDRGQRCANPGTISPTTLGKGPWHCATHSPILRWDQAQQAAGEPTANYLALTTRLRNQARPGPRPVTDNLADVEAIAERLAIQTEPPLSVNR